MVPARSPGSPELLKSESDMASKSFTFTHSCIDAGCSCPHACTQSCIAAVQHASSRLERALERAQSQVTDARLGNACSLELLPNIIFNMRPGNSQCMVRLSA